MLPAHLAPFNIDYVQMEEIGGLRSKSKDVEPEINGFWHNQSFHNYADCTLSEPFCHSLAQLIELGRQQRCAIMCSEAVCWRCHRRIVVDQLIARGESVFHLRGKDKIDPAKLTTEAKIQKNGEVITIRLKNNTLRPLLSFNQASCS